GVVPVAGDARHPRHVRSARRRRRSRQIVVDDAPMIAVDLLADRPVIAFAVDAQVGDDRPLAYALERQAVDRGDAAAGHAAGEGTPDVHVLSRVTHENDRAGPFAAAGSGARLIAVT